jgi:hypothetical protein
LQNKHDPRPPSMITAERHDFEDAKTQTARRAAPIHVSEVLRPNRLFSKLAMVFGRDARGAHGLLSPLMARADVAPQALTREQLTAMAPGLLEIIETVLPVDEREQARGRLAELLIEEPTVV